MRSSWVMAALLAIAPSASSSAQQSHLDTRQQIEQMAMRFSELYNQQDAAAIASMFTKDAVRVSELSAISAGPQAIEQSFKTQFETGFSRIDLIIDQVPLLGTDAAITIGKYQVTGQGQSGPLKVNGNWTEVEVREEGVWKIRLLTLAPKPAPNIVPHGLQASAGSAGPEPKSEHVGAFGAEAKKTAS
jgi:uncharacterized protein (TIGR02246 family)